MATELTRRRFIQGSAGIALGGPLSALAAQAAQGRVRTAVGYGPLLPTPEQDSGGVYLELPKGFQYRVVSRDTEPMSDGNPTPGIFDGTGAFPGPRGTTVLIRNHENRSRPNEIRVEVPAGKRYDPDPNVRGGNTKLVVDNRSRRVVESFAVLGGTHTNCAGGVTPWGSWITCEEIFNYGSDESNQNNPPTRSGGRSRAAERSERGLSVSARASFAGRSPKWPPCPKLAPMGKQGGMGPPQEGTA